MIPSAVQSNPRLALLLVVAFFLGMAVLFTRVDFAAMDLPLPGAVQDLRRELETEKDEYRRLVEKRAAELGRRAEVLALADPLWRSGHRPAQAVVQDEFEDLARRARVVIQTLGSPRITDYSDNIQQVELTVRIRASMREIARLFVQVDAADPPFFWSQCTIRPNNPKNPSGVVLSGRVATLMLKPEATKLLDAGKQEESP